MCVCVCVLPCRILLQGETVSGSHLTDNLYNVLSDLCYYFAQPSRAGLRHDQHQQQMCKLTERQHLFQKQVRGGQPGCACEGVCCKIWVILSKCFSPTRIHPHTLTFSPFFPDFTGNAVVHTVSYFGDGEELQDV